MFSTNATSASTQLRQAGTLHCSQQLRKTLDAHR
jgi:hypothetical protein